MIIGLIREGKKPTDSRVALTPVQCKYVEQVFGFKIIVEPSPTRCYSDTEYEEAGVELGSNLSGCDVLLGIKEVPINFLKENKTYFFFSHTIKEQVHNRDLLRAVLDKNITLIDYEVLKNESGERVIAFGKFAGMVGAHNGLLAYGLRKGTYKLPRLKDLQHYNDVLPFYKSINFSPLRVVVTGKGRVANGAIQVLTDAGFKQVNPYAYLHQNFNYPVFTQLEPADYAARFDYQKFSREDFYAHPEKYVSVFEPYMRRSDIFMNAIFYDPKAPPFFSAEDMNSLLFKIEVIADITCDIMPESSVPSTLFASTIENPFFGYDTHSGKVVNPFIKNAVTVMSVDNLPNELARDASLFFGEQFIQHILPQLKNPQNSPLLEGGTIARNGALTPPFNYLSHYVGALEV